MVQPTLEEREMSGVERSDSSEPPSARHIGREFVRQYYTMLAEAPHYVYRFYSNDSIFIHGESHPIVGQGKIQQKIEELNFNTCTAKIRKVDACESYQKAVVIQVLGELSMNGASSMRFMQTFVLAPQGLKKYYVYNDIFRYVDESFDQDDVESNSSKRGRLVSLGESGSAAHSITSGDGHRAESEGPTESGRSVSNGAAHPDELAHLPQPPPPPPQQVVHSEGYMPMPQRGPSALTQMSFVDNQTPEKDMSVEVAESPHIMPPDAAQMMMMPSPASSEPPDPNSGQALTWAQRANKRTAGGMMSGGPGIPLPSLPQTTLPPMPQPAPVLNSAPPILPGSSSPPDQSEVVGQRADSGKKDLFIGNLPIGVNDEEVKAFFGQFGEVQSVRCRLAPRQDYDGRSGGDRYTIAFLSFTNSDALSKVFKEALQAPGKSGAPRYTFMYREGHEIFVEEKRDDGGPRRGNDSYRGGRGGGAFSRGGGARYNNTGGGRGGLGGPNMRGGARREMRGGGGGGFRTQPQR